MATNLWVGLTSSDLSTQNWVALSDKRQVLFVFRYTYFFLQIIKRTFYLLIAFLIYRSKNSTTIFWESKKTLLVSTEMLWASTKTLLVSTEMLWASTKTLLVSTEMLWESTEMLWESTEMLWESKKEFWTQNYKLWTQKHRIAKKKRGLKILLAFAFKKHNSL